jgi:integrase
VQFILEVCRSVYAFAIRMRHLPPYSENPFSGLRIESMRLTDSKPVFVFDAESELAFFKAASEWAFPIHFTLAKTGLRPGELAHLLIEDLDLRGGWLSVCNKPDLGWLTKTRNERRVPLIPELVAVLKHVVGQRQHGLVFLRPKFCDVGVTPREMADRIQRNRESAARQPGQPLSREAELRVAQSIWRSAGMVKADKIRNSFLSCARRAGLQNATCPKSWRHSFATLLQDANVDPLIRQVTLGHRPAGSGGGLGMTAVYTHTRPETQYREVERALRLWPQSLSYSQRWLQAQGGQLC